MVEATTTDKPTDDNAAAGTTGGEEEKKDGDNNQAVVQQSPSSDIMQKKALIEKRLEETGEKARLEEYLKQRLIESGWRDELKKHCLDIIKQKGLERINLEDLVEELLPKGRSLVSTQVKEDLLGQIKQFLENDPDYRSISGF